MFPLKEQGWNIEDAAVEGESAHQEVEQGNNGSQPSQSENSEKTDRSGHREVPKLQKLVL